MCVCAKSLQSCPTLCDPMDYRPPGCSVHGILQEEYWSEFLPPGDLLHPGTETASLMSPGLAGSLPLLPPGKPHKDTSPPLRTSLSIISLPGPCPNTATLGWWVRWFRISTYESRDKTIKSKRGKMSFLQLPSRYFVCLDFSNLNICLYTVCLFSLSLDS